MPGGGGEGKVLTLLKGFSERWRDMKSGSGGEWADNGVGGADRREEENALKVVDWRGTRGGGCLVAKTREKITLT